MRIPTSSIVLGLVTCVPFGLAIRDSLKHKDPLANLDDYPEPQAIDDTEYEQQMARDEAERMAREQATRVKTNAARKALFGIKPAQLGAMFVDVSLGEPMDIAMKQYGVLETTDANIGLDFQYDGSKLSRINVQLLEDCSTFADDLKETWGASTNDGWISADGKQRATLDSLGCTFVIEPTQDAASWLKALPIAAIGRPADALREKVTILDTDDSGFSWNGIGAGIANGGTRFEAYTTNGKLVGFTASVDTDRTTSNAILMSLQAERGEPKTDEYGVMTYKGKPAMKLDLTDGHLNLTVGTLP